MIMVVLAVYGAFLALLDKIGVIRWNRYWTLTFPVLWAIMQVLVLLPMAWQSPQGPAIVLRNTVAISPSVTGEVIDVPVTQDTPIKAGEVLFQIDPTPYQAAVKALQAQLSVQEERLAIDTQLKDRDVRSAIQVVERKATVDNLRAQLETANWNLKNTTVRAPADGFVTNVALRKGARVTGAPVMAFVDTSLTGIGVEIAQSNTRFIKPGQPVELAFKFDPGTIHAGKVRSVLQATSNGQTAPSGQAATPIQIAAAPFVVVVDLDDQAFADTLPMGGTGMAAIYTDHTGISRIIRKITLRQISIFDYLNLF